MPPETNFAHRAYFRHHAEHLVNEMLIEPPIFGSDTGQQFISIARRIELSGGGFGGAVFLAMTPAFGLRCDLSVASRAEQCIATQSSWSHHSQSVQSHVRRCIAKAKRAALS